MDGLTLPVPVTPLGKDSGEWDHDRVIPVLGMRPLIERVLSRREIIVSVATPVGGKITTRGMHELTNVST